MSDWNEIDDSDISVDVEAGEVDILVTSNEFGNIYATLTFAQVGKIYGKIVAAEKRLPPFEWEKETGVTIMDADGWRFGHGELKAKPYDEPITRKEFDARVVWSTTTGID